MGFSWSLSNPKMMIPSSKLTSLWKTIRLDSWFTYKKWWCSSMVMLNYQWLQEINGKTNRLITWCILIYQFHRPQDLFLWLWKGQTIHHPHVFRLQGKLSISLGTYFEESLCRILVSQNMQYPYDGKNQHVQPISWPVGGVPHSQTHPNHFFKVGLCQISRISPTNIPSNPAL